MIIQWRKSDKIGNFGDELTTLLINTYSKKGVKLLQSPHKSYLLIGSTISDYWIEYAATINVEEIHFWGCGFRGEQITSNKLSIARFHGVRGEDTQLFLKKMDIDTEVIGDTAFLIPLLVKGEKVGNKKIFMPHINDPQRFDYSKTDLNVDEIIQPDINSPEDLIKIIKAISSASFVLAGAMHAGIVACAYNRPFGFFGSTHIDCPPKYNDFLSAINLSGKIEFFNNTTDANKWYEEIRENMQNISLHRILSFAPAQIKINMRIRAHVYDLTVKYSGEYIKRGSVQVILKVPYIGRSIVKGLVATKSLIKKLKP